MTARHGVPEARRGRYGVVSLGFWDDPKVRRWGDDARLLALYVLTYRDRTSEGYFRLSLATAADDLGWSASRIDAALEQLVADDFIDYDREARLVLVVRAMRYGHVLKGAPSITGALNALARVEEGSPRLFDRFLESADTYQPQFAAAIRAKYGLVKAPCEGASSPQTPTPTQRED